MLRTDLDLAAQPMQTPAPPPHFSPPAPPPPPPPRARRPPPPPRKPPNRTARIVLWSMVAVLVLALVGTTTWWFTAGRWRTVPAVANKAEVDAVQLLTDEDLNPQVAREYHNDVDPGRVIRTDPGQGEKMLRGEPIKLVVSKGKPKVPDVAPGTDVAVAEKRIKEAGLTPDRDDGQNKFSEDVAKGKVIELNPPSGNVLEVGKRVVLIISKGPEPKPVPDVRNKTREEAFAELRNQGYEPYELPAEFSADIDGGRVVRTDPEAGKTVEGDDKRVGVVVSTAITVPDLAGRTVDEAKPILEGLGLKVEVQSFGGGGGARVFGQNPGPNSRVQRDSTVIIYAVP